jgi:hypothetical protein
MALPPRMMGLPPRPSGKAPFTCPLCGAVSHNPNDKRERYCGRCHVFVDDDPRPPEAGTEGDPAR